MSDSHFNDPFRAYTQGAEQDQQGDGDLPAYDDLAAQHSPNSRFGRWRGWIEKRAAERYADLTPEELARRRARGWDGDQGHLPASQQLGDIDFVSDRHRHEQNLQVDGSQTCAGAAPDGSRPNQARGAPIPLRIRTNRDLPDVPTSSADQGTTGTDSESADSFTSMDPLAQSLPELQGTACETILPTHLQIHQFGSRFLPHSTSPIRCILPIHRDRLLLIGTDTGLSVLDMYPMEWANDGNAGIVQKGPVEAQARVVWTGEAVYQMSILEHEDIGEGTPQGVVLALVGPEPAAPSVSNGYQEPLRTLRMYNLASLTSLAKWTIAQRGSNPVDLRRASDWNVQQTPVKKHRPTGSITRGLKQLIESPTRTQQPAASYETYLAVPSTRRHATTASADASWDVVDDLPLRWATDFVPLASAGSRLASLSVISYALWHEGGPGPGGGRHGRRALLAVATKYNIFLYETPKGERAFHFVKEFYTPVQPRQLIFAHQSVDISRISSESVAPRAGHSRGGPSDSAYNTRASAAPGPHLTYSAQMAVFVVFEKKAGLIRIADAAVTEVEMYDAGSNTNLISSSSFMSTKDSLSVGGTLNSRRSRNSTDYMAFKEAKGAWIVPSLVDIPAAQLPGGDTSPEKSVYVLTRGKVTHIVPSPLPAVVNHAPPIHSLVWSSCPTSVNARICLLSREGSPSETHPFLQLVAFIEDGIEVEEIPLVALVGGTKGKGKAVLVPAEPRHGQAFVGETGSLAQGGHWHRLPSEITAQALERTDSTASGRSFESVHTEEVVARLKAEAGVYGWMRKSGEDWRVFWVGGDARDVDGQDEEEDGVLV